MRSSTIPILACSLLLLLGDACLVLAENSHTDHPPVAPEKSQTFCPVMGGPIDKGLYVDAKGKRIYLCCAACEDAIRAEPDKYIKKIEGRGETIADTPKTQ